MNATCTEASTAPQKRGPRKRFKTAMNCRRCGKPIAEQLVTEALCCQCRYRSTALDFVSKDED